jgi:acyl-CoA hydrolase
MSEPNIQAPRPARDSATEMTEIVLPQHTNTLGTVFGGAIMSWIDVCAAIVARRHCGRPAVTAFVDDLAFLAPAYDGDIVRLAGRVNATYRTSLEVEVVVEREEPETGTRALCVDAFLTFVNIDDDGRPIAVPPLLIETDDDRRRVEEATARRERRKTARRARER